MRKFQSIFLLTLLLPLFTLAQTTTGSITGVVKDASGQTLIGATITATHMPTGTIYRVQSRTGGRFDVANMNPGGPYKIEASYTGYKTQEHTEVYLGLGEAIRQDFTLAIKGQEIDVVTISGKRSTKSGTETVIGRDKTANLPRVSGSIADLVRLTPQAKVDNNGGISIAGQNNRFNSFYIDGALNNDVFGLSNSGTNGGSTGTPPISIDAIDQFQVAVSPYDASLGNFTGGSINAITRSGTNKLDGSVYYLFRNQDLAGKTPGVAKEQAKKLNNSLAQVAGFRIGGPIIKNKLFYFLNAEIQREDRAQPFEFSNYEGKLTISKINQLRDTLISKYQYDPGGFLDNHEKVVANRITAKVDWNISDNNKLSISYRYNQAERTNASQSSKNTINFYNNGYLFPNTTHSTSVELKTNLRKGATNRLLLTYVSSKDDRGPMGNPFPRVTIDDTLRNSIIFGTENSSTANKLTQYNLALFDAFKINLGKHSLTFGTDNEFSYSNNVFIRNSFGAYRYGSLNAFLNNTGPSLYNRSYSAIDDVIGDNTNAAAKFSTLRLSLFANDDIRVNSHFSINVGLRLDATSFITTPREDTFFNNRAIPVISQYYNLEGAKTGQISSPSISFSPRLGFNYKIDDEGVVIRGGVGLFTGRVPLVWPGGVYNNNGVTLIDPRYPTTKSTPTSPLVVRLADLAKNPLPFVADPFKQYLPTQVNGANINSKGEINLISKNFKLPKSLRFSIAADKKFGDGWTFTTEAVFTKAINEINYTNVNITPSDRTLVGADNRPTYWIKGASGYFASVDTVIAINGRSANNPYNSIYLLSNNKNSKSFAANITFILDKAFKNGFSYNLAYTYGTSFASNEGTSSQNSSQWRFMETVGGRNRLYLTESDFSIGHRVNSYVSKKFEYAHKQLATTITVFYNGQSGNPFSYTYQNSPVGEERSGTNDLIYIPKGADEIIFGKFNSATNPSVNQFTLLNATESAAMWKELDNYINGNKYLSSRRGLYAERNGDRLYFTHVLDLKIAQDFNIKVAKKMYKIQLSYDIFNFTNFLNRNWGRQYFLTNDNFQPITFLGLTTDGKPVYNFQTIKGNPDNPGLIGDGANPSTSSRWTSQLGLRISF